MRSGEGKGSLLLSLFLLLMNKDSFSKPRKEYVRAALTEEDAGQDPWSLFSRWYAQALEHCAGEANAFCLATVNSDLQPSARMVLLKEVRDQQLLFFTNYKSRKSQDLDFSNKVSAVFYWAELEQQIRIEGTVTRSDRETSMKYFSSRPRGSQLSAVVSAQSQPVESRASLEQSRTALDQALQNQLPECPEYWGGYAIKPSRSEFWQGRQDKLHDRILFISENLGWKRIRLAP